MKTATARTAVCFRNILFATDFSSAAAHAIPYVKRIAKHYDADLVALHVRPPAVNPMTQPGTWPDEETTRKQKEEYRDELLGTFAGIRTTVLIEEGDIQSRLQEAIEKTTPISWSLERGAAQDSGKFSWVPSPKRFSGPWSAPY